MASPTPQFSDDEEELVTGTVYRRIPDWPNYIDHASGKPRFIAFTPRPNDRGATSMLLKGMVREEDARTNFGKLTGRPFGLCEVDIAEALRETSGMVSCWRRRGHYHVRLYGCADDAVAAIIASIAKVVPPSAPLA